MGGAGWLAGPGVALREGLWRMLLGTLAPHFSEPTLYQCVHHLFRVLPTPDLS